MYFVVCICRHISILYIHITLSCIPTVHCRFIDDDDRKISVRKEVKEMRRVSAGATGAATIYAEKRREERE